MEMVMSQPNIRMHDLKVEEILVASLQRAPRNARLHSKAQVKQIVASFKEFGVVTPIVVDEANIILAGHGRLTVAPDTARFLSSKRLASFSAASWSMPRSMYCPSTNSKNP